MALFESHDTGEFSALSQNRVTPNNWTAMLFNSPLSHTVTEVQLYLSQLSSGGDSPGTITASIRAVDGNGDPTGGDLVSGTIDGDTLSQSPTYAWHAFDLGAGVDLDEETNYAIIFRAAWNDGTGNITMLWRMADENNLYVRGNASTSSDAGSTWSDISNALYFKESGTLLSPSKADTPAPGNTATGVSTNQATLSWEPGGVAGRTDNYDVYFGPSGNMSQVVDGESEKVWSITGLPLNYGTSYQWKVDAIGGGQTITGDVWSFTTLTLSPPIIAGFHVVKRLVAAADGKFWYEDI
jgi:hypothetical protein